MRTGYLFLAAAAVALPACGEERCEWDDGRRYEVHVIEKYGPESAYTYDEGYGLGALVPCEGLSDLLPGSAFTGTLHQVEEGECSFSMRLDDAPAVFLRFDENPVFTNRDVYARYEFSTSNCSGSWRMEFRGDGSRWMDSPTVGGPPPTVLRRGVSTDGDCPGIPTGCADAFVVDIDPL